MDKKRRKRIIQKSKNWFKRYKSILIMVFVVFLFVLIPPLTNLMISAEAFIFPSFFGFINDSNQDAWIDFFGAIIGGALTLIGVAWTIVDQNTKRREDAMDAVKPILVANACTYEEIKGINGDNHSRVFECILEYKNVGKGILFNPRVLNIEYKVDNKDIGQLNTSLSVKSYLDIEDTSNNDLMIIFGLDDLNEMQEILKGRGNVLPIQIIMYVGGKDMYDRDVVTKLNYKTSLSFFADNEIELPLHGGKLTSVVISDKNEILDIMNNANWRYNVHR